MLPSTWKLLVKSPTCCGEEEKRAGSLWAPPVHHALFTLDHEPLVLVEAADAADDVLVLLVPVVLVAHRGLAAVGLARRLPHDLVDLGRGLVPGVVVGLAQPAHVPPRRGLPAVVFLEKSKKNPPKVLYFQVLSCLAPVCARLGGVFPTAAAPKLGAPLHLPPDSDQQVHGCDVGREGTESSPGRRAWGDG